MKLRKLLESRRRKYEGKRGTRGKSLRMPIFYVHARLTLWRTLGSKVVWIYTFCIIVLSHACNFKDITYICIRVEALFYSNLSDYGIQVIRSLFASA